MNTSLDDILERYEQLWRDGQQAPSLGQFLADCDMSVDQRREVLADLVAIDMEYRWRASSGDESLRDTAAMLGAAAANEDTITDTIGERPTLEKYVRQWPELGESARIAAELPAEEFRVRHRWGDCPDIDGFLQRFNGDQRLRSELLAVLDELQRDQDGVGNMKQSADATSLPTAGESFGRYRLIRQLGKGGMGEVYLAEDTQLERRVALKIPHLGESDLVQKRFVNEAKAAAMLHHPNICPVFDAGEINGQPFLTMAYIEGTTLREAWHRDGNPSVDEIAMHFATIADAMQAAHDAGIVHRDLKPSNVMINREGHAVVMDFGLAFRGAATDERLTQTGDAFGSPAYMSPEQIEGDYTKVGPASDIYSLGVMLYEALTGSLPFTGTASAIAVRIARDKPPQPSALRRDCPRELERLCLRMLDKRPAARPASMSEVAVVFREFAQRQSQFEPARPAAITKQVSNKGRRVGLAASLIGLAIVGLLAATLVIKVQTDKGEVVIKSFDPDIEVLVKRNGKPVDEIALSSDSVSTTLRTGEISVEVKGVKLEGVRIKNGKFELTKNDRVVVEILPAASTGGDIANNHQGPSLLDQLRREDITPYQRKVAGGGDPSKAPQELVAVLGDSRLQHEHRAATDVRFTSDGRTLVSGGEDGKIRFWDVESSELLREIQTAGRIVQIALSPNEQQVATLFDLGGTCVSATFDIATGEQKFHLDNVSCNLLGMDWLDDQHLICLEDGREEQLTVRNVANGETLRAFATPPAGFPLVSLSPDRKQLAVALRHPVEDAFRVALFATETGECLLELSNASFTNQKIAGIAWHPSGKSLAIVEANRVLRWNIESGEVESADGTAWVKGVAWVPDGQLLATIDAEGVVFLEPDRMKQTTRLSSPIPSMAATLRFSSNGKYIAATSYLGAVLLWDVSTGKLVDGFDGHWNAVTSVSVSSDGKHIASSSLDRSVRLWDAATGKEKHRYVGNSGEFSDFYDVAFSPDSNLVAASGRAGTGLKIWDVASREVKFELPLRISQEGTQVRWAEDSSSIMLSTNNPASLRIYALRNRKPTFQIDLQSEALFGADYHSGANLLAAASGERVLLWQVGTKEPVSELILDSLTTSVEFSPEGSTLLVAGPNFSPRLYDSTRELGDGDSFRELLPHDKSSISAAIFDHSGNRIATLDSKRRLVLWDANTLEELHRIQLPEESRYHFTHYQRQLAFAPDNRHILVANNNGTVYVLRLPQ